MVIKIAGCLVVLIAATSGGYVVASGFAGRVRDLRLIQEGLQMLESEILFTSTPLPEALQRTAGRLDKPVGRVFGSAAQVLERRIGYTAAEAWSMAFDHNRELLRLNREDLEIVCGFGSNLGATDRENQEKSFRLVRHQLRMQQVKAEEERDKNERMYKNLGFLLGAALVILLI